MSHRRARVSTPRLWRCLVVLQVLTCLGAGLVSAVLPDDPSQPPGYYDGDDDDAAATPEPLDVAAALIVDTTGVGLPVRAPALFGLAADSIGPPRPATTPSPLLRSPPA